MRECWCFLGVWDSGAMSCWSSEGVAKNFLIFREVDTDMHDLLPRCQSGVGVGWDGMGWAGLGDLRGVRLTWLLLLDGRTRQRSLFCGCNIDGIFLIDEELQIFTCWSNLWYLRWYLHCLGRDSSGEASCECGGGWATLSRALVDGSAVMEWGWVSSVDSDAHRDDLKYLV